ncbi:MAG: acetyl-CoA carboxylase carboxyltransferase subunit alpha [Alphaproteobacteria bacterium]|nr:acetyl-CoA carboxylase carboxyltransferase subunit alpha [Alphaproteobacteria bacterium]
MDNYLDFETEIRTIEGRIENLHRGVEHVADGVNLTDELARLEKKLARLYKQIYSNLSAWQKTQVARHQDRPHCLDYIHFLIQDFQILAGDRLFGEDEAFVCGLGRFRGKSVMVIGQEKGHDIDTRLKHNFGMAKPEGYRKAVRLMKLAERFNIPIITFVDTAGAFPGVEGEERGQAAAIAEGIDTCFSVGVPLISVIIGEGGSGGAIAIATANRILMLENSIYSVISPEGCASILWRDATLAEPAAQALCLTAQDLQRLNLIDEIVPEPFGGAHRHREEVINAVGDTIYRHLAELSSLSAEQLKKDRSDKFLAMTRA